MKVFISHITEEARLAKVLKSRIENTFAGNVDCFVSSDNQDIPAGSKWLDKIKDGLNGSKLSIILCSPVSISRPWINFEAGASWIKDIPLVPICHSGLTKSSLPSPLSTFQGLDIDDDKFTHDFLSSMAKHLEFSQIPDINHSDFKQEIKKSLSSIVLTQPKGEVFVENNKSSQLLLETEKQILIFLGNNQDEEEEGWGTQFIASSLNFPFMKGQYILDKLIIRGLVRFFDLGDDGYYYLTDEGKAFLVENNLI